MGNQSSQAVVEYPIQEEELHIAPHNFYLVFGAPSLRFARDRARGPLIYDVDIEYDEDENTVERTATLDLACAVPRRQKFELVVPPASAGTGLALTFHIASDKPPRWVRVYAGATVEYHAGEGVRLTSDAHSTSGAFCVYDTRNTEGLTTVQTEGGIFPQHLRPVALEEALRVAGPSTVKRVTYAPLVIEVDIGEAEEPIQNAKQTPASPVDRAEKASGSRQDPLCATNPSPTSPPPTPPPASPTLPLRQHIVHYTILEVPTAAVDFMAASHGSASPPPRFPCTVAKQLLQVGSEVYDLEDVFDVGRDDDAPNVAANSDEDEGLCVICLTNPKDTTILPCRHLCVCSACGTQLRQVNNKCPLCRGNIDRLMTL